MNEEFFTFREYMKKEDGVLTASMEDYLEMIYRLCSASGYARIHEVASALNVQPPSATKMVQKLSDLDLLRYEKYGIILLSEKGELIGKALIQRHNLIERFLSLLGVSEGLLEETEKIEHTLGIQTLKCLRALVEFAEEHPEFLEEFNRYRHQKENSNK